MLIIDSKDCENIDKALKKYKKKFEKSKILLQLRERQAFIKPSIRRRKEVLKAVYKEQVSAGKFDQDYINQQYIKLIPGYYNFGYQFFYAAKPSSTYSAVYRLP